MSSRSNILLVDDNPAMIQVMGKILSGLGQLCFATSGEAALRQAQKSPPDLILLDAEMPGMSGFQVCEAIKEDPALCEIPVIFVTAHSGMEFELAGFDRGAVDFIAKPISEPLLAARVKTQLRLKQLTDELRRVSSVDALTELANRRSFVDALDREWRRGARDGQPISLLLIDVDHFKLFNDRYGHPAGDGALRAVASALRRSCMRPADLVARYGGEEFVILLPQTARLGAEHVARLAIQTVNALRIPHADSKTAEWLTVSVGVGYFDESSEGWGVDDKGARVEAQRSGRDPFIPQQLVACADQALYHAKLSGRARASRLDIAAIGMQPMALDVFPGSRLPLIAPLTREAA
jgi:diguanylate cyclase (GGDEF)-like protein